MGGPRKTAGQAQVTVLSRGAAVVSFALLAPIAAVSLLAVNGSLTYDSSLGLPDPGTLTRVGLPAAKGLRDLTSALTIGALVIIAVTLPAADKGRALELSGLRQRVLHVVTATALAWFWASLAVLAFSYADLAGAGVTTAEVRGQLLYFATEFELGKLLFISALLVAVLSFASLFVQTMVGVGALTLISLAALWPLALTGHAAGSSNHDLGANALFVHLVAVAVWVGGLAALAWVRKRLQDDLPVVVRRYSRMAGICFAAVVISGVASALLRVTSWSQLTSAYGAVLGAKVIALVLLGLAGWRQRRSMLPRLEAGSIGFSRLVVLELLLMATALGAGVALSRTAPPSSALQPLTTAESLLGYPMPPELTWVRWFTYWEVDSFWAPAAALAVVGYLVGVRRLRKRGDRWPVGRTVSWLVGCAMVLWATSGSPGAYGEVLFSMHMVQHMTIATGAPLFLTLGAPVTLALRSLHHRVDGSLGPREWLLLVVHSRLARFLGNPVVAAGLFIVSLVAFYNSGLLEASLRGHTMHLFMVGHFLIAGYLFANAVVGIDPGPRRPAYPFRVLIVMVTFGFHAFFSVSLMSSSRVLAESWFSSLDRGWGRSLLDDQYFGASLGWALGDYPLAVLAGVLLWGWFRSDQREAARHDRRSDRDGDHDRNSYNQYLAALSERRGGPR